MERPGNVKIFICWSLHFSITLKKFLKSDGVPSIYVSQYVREEQAQVAGLGDDLCCLRDTEEVTWRKEQSLLLWQRSPGMASRPWGEVAETLRSFLSG